MRDLINILTENAAPVPSQSSAVDRLIAAAEDAIHALLDTDFSSDREVANALRDAISDVQKAAPPAAKPSRAYTKGHADAMARRAVDPPRDPTERAEYMAGFEDARR